MDCIISYHLDSLRSGVARFNAILAQRLNIPLLGIFDDAIFRYQRPLLSFKISELNREEVISVSKRIAKIQQGRSLCLFLHDFTGRTIEINMVRKAEIVYCGNREIYSKVRAITPRAVELWVPSLLVDVQRFNPTEISVFSFRMAHKIKVGLYRKLHHLLEKTGKSYSLILSTAFHKSVSFEDSSCVFKYLRKIFGNYLYFTGFLSDAAVYNYLINATFFAAFFDQGVRANNTTVNAAMECGAVVITNLDQYSPKYFKHMKNLIDINQCHSLPTDKKLLNQIRQKAKETANSMSWDFLVEKLAKNKS